jgi:hypothetical protein
LLAFAITRSRLADKPRKPLLPQVPREEILKGVPEHLRDTVVIQEGPVDEAWEYDHVVGVADLDHKVVMAKSGYWGNFAFRPRRGYACSHCACSSAAGSRKFIDGDTTRLDAASS